MTDGTLARRRARVATEAAPARDDPHRDAADTARAMDDFLDHFLGAHRFDACGNPADFADEDRFYLVDDDEAGAA